MLRSRLIAAALSAVLLVGCRDKKLSPLADAAPSATVAEAPPPFEIPVLSVPPIAMMSRDEAMRARQEFELAPEAYMDGTDAIFFRDHFLPQGSPLVFDEADWIGRLRAAFGPRPDDHYVFRHRPSGFVVTAYLKNGAAMFGGAYKVEGTLSAKGPADAGVSPAARAEVAARIAADPILAAKSPRDRALAHYHGKVPSELLLSRALKEADHAWDRQFARVTAPLGSAPVFERLGAIIEAMAPAEWSGLRHWADGEVQRIGIRSGVSFKETLPAGEALAVLLAAVEDKPGHAPITQVGLVSIGPDYDAVRYWINHRERNDALEAERTRVQNAWFRLAARLRALASPDAGTGTRLALAAKADAEKLGIDPAKADAALR